MNFASAAGIYLFLTRFTGGAMVSKVPPMLAARRVAVARPLRVPRRIAFGDFVVTGGRVSVRQTGNSAALDLRLAREVGGWLVFQAALRVRALFVRRRAAIWFAPQVPHDRYLVRAAMRLAGLGVARTREAAAAAFYFEDTTSAPPPVRSHARALNFDCNDISKSRVATIFEQVFGYPLAVDPRRWNGVAVEKSEHNGTHDGRIVDCPRAALPGKSYSRLIDTVDGDGLAVDLRTHVIGGAPVLVWVKRRPAAARFLPPNDTATLCRPEDVFSADELARLGEFARAMGADWCGLDVLRDRDGRIYVVDVNKTDAGPVVALSLADKLRSTALMARALRKLVEA